MISEFLLTRPIHDDASVLIWDFADTIERLMRSSSSSDIVLGNGEILDKFVARSERLSLKKQQKLKALREEKDIETVSPCSFKPEVVVNPLFDQVKPKYLTAPAVRASITSPRDVSFSSQLRDYPKEGAYYSAEGVALTPFVLNRLKQAEEFHEIHRGEMFELRSLNLS